VLADGSWIVEEGDEANDPCPLLAPIELPPPYRLRGVRRSETAWAVGARALRVASLGGVRGDELELVCDGGGLMLRIDGVPTLARVAELEAIGAARGRSWIVRARRLRGDDWEVDADPL
jgi:hypothetical protein